MGLKTKRNNVTYLGAKDGMLVRRVKEATETSVERTITKGVNQGKVVHEELFDALEGRIIGLFKKESKVSFQPDIYITLELVMRDEDGDTFQISFPYSSSYTRGLLTKIEKVDLEKDCEVCTYWIKGDDGKYRAYLGLLQYGEKITPAYSTDEKTLPEVKTVKVGKKTHYDDEDLLSFYDKILEKFEGVFKIANTEKPKDRIPADDTQQTHESAVEFDEDGNEIKDGKVPF